MGVTIRKMKQPKFARNPGMIFYRVKNNGEIIQDFKTKREAKKFATKLRLANR